MWDRKRRTEGLFEEKWLERWGQVEIQEELRGTEWEEEKKRTKP